MTSVKKVPKRPLSCGLSAWEVMRLKFSLGRSACSGTWIDDQFVTVTETDSDGDQLRITLFDPRVFPPGGRLGTGMRWCRGCGRYTPPPAVSLIEHRESRLGPVISATLMCDDCRIADDDDQHRELYEAGLHLRPTGSQSFVTRQMLYVDRLRKP